KAYLRAPRARLGRGVREPMERLLDELSEEFGGNVHLFRQHRDVRFSPDKSPYKTRTYGVLHPTDGSRPGLYAQVSTRGLYAGTGYWRMASDQLERFRAKVVDDETGEQLEAIAAGAEAAGLE